MMTPAESRDRAFELAQEELLAIAPLAQRQRNENEAFAGLMTEVVADLRAVVRKLDRGLGGVSVRGDGRPPFTDVPEPSTGILDAEGLRELLEETLTTASQIQQHVCGALGHAPAGAQGGRPSNGRRIAELVRFMLAQETMACDRDTQPAPPRLDRNGGAKALALSIVMAVWGQLEGEKLEEMTRLVSRALKADAG